MFARAFRLRIGVCAFGVAVRLPTVVKDPAVVCRPISAMTVSNGKCAEEGEHFSTSEFLNQRVEAALQVKIVRRCSSAEAGAL